MRRKIALKIELLTQRESFYEIFEESLDCFLEIQFSQTTLDECAYRVNEKLNIIYPCELSRHHLLKLISEYRYHRFFIRRILQNIYVSFAVLPFFESLLSPKVMMLKIPVTSKNNWVFIPGNHTIRIIDTGSDVCSVFSKKGFDDEFARKDSKTRLEHPELRVPRVISQGEGWFKEERIRGVPLDKLKNKIMVRRIIDGTRKELRTLYGSSECDSPLADYGSKLVAQISDIVKNSLWDLKAFQASLVFDYANKLNTILSNHWESGAIKTVVSHGDFHPGNILCSGAEFWLVDWEYSDRRSLFYDALVFHLRARSVTSLGKRMDVFISELASGVEFFEWTGTVLEESCQYYVVIFLLEDMLVRLKEIRIARMYDKSLVIEPYLKEVVVLNQVIRDHFLSNSTPTYK